MKDDPISLAAELKYGDWDYTPAETAEIEAGYAKYLEAKKAREAAAKPAPASAAD
jgi:hypothetical protein